MEIENRGEAGAPLAVGIQGEEQFLDVEAEQVADDGGGESVGQAGDVEGAPVSAASPSSSKSEKMAGRLKGTRETFRIHVVADKGLPLPDALNPRVVDGGYIMEGLARKDLDDLVAALKKYPDGVAWSVFNEATGKAVQC